MPGSTFVGGSIDIQVRFESMGGNARRAQVYRRHEDLQREYEHKVKAMARETRYTTSKLSRIQAEHLVRMKAIEKLEPTSYREEWPSLEERRAINLQMQEGITRLVLPGAPSKTKAASPKTSEKMEKNSGGSTPHRSASLSPPIVKQKTNVPKLHGVLTKAHMAPLKNHKEAEKAGEVKNGVVPPQEATSATNKTDIQPMKQKQAIPTTKDQLRLADTSTTETSTSRTHRNPRLAVPPRHPLRVPAHPSKQTSVSRDRPPRPRFRGRHTWGKQENVLLFSIEAREGKVTYTHVTKRRYPSMV